MSITRWFAVGCALTLGTSGLTMGVALASDASADAAAARAFNGGSDPGRRDEQVSSGVRTETELVALGASDGAADRATANTGGAAGLTVATPNAPAAGSAEPFGPLGASDASSDAQVARAGRSTAPWMARASKTAEISAGSAGR